ncbi:DNA polymerase III subunit beta [Candidatus Kaiserbacteria bacterium RIFCSPLOWO2_02_FULL_54_13]|uniref:Beta sliding clamp n=1 Tax=Candidatus Kaiserbacteria bacterium RIFCSPHIGHO2_02_FULL_54_22 TaxID=1798495 RepID=A0A1F6DKU7_9BACT|nr:MAG: polymerase III subunit beta protein [Parcubacteria group bacterium GW2011_GWA1_54_9]OGG62055.1 MAG: DNA polymerase III subunit beta [Candidatus Kaiserbacteria bacterium RIFCSPHIGHO2_02_FULL_54_22]OGG68615.1 MAG: DNA polymerase III subunit beta [Candidatus Kaiserbacteria bacterium RIFCSPHIGHO2_12_FULL_54_16]OGG83864.1 MAG: DNA polymerase III subunit beta [Candidatus Kaiserbacteria bacterium RIFCSPLOWO2_02_FULL_54_13]OGG90171.1 MAG: DNA polymerase III subunit beta [Candidatus Kaiserbacter
MIISIEKKKFSEAVHTVSRFAERRSTTLPALSSILIIAGDEGIKMRATNLETGVDLKLEGDCTTKGAVAIPATILQQIASSLAPEGKITIEHAGDTISITSGNSKSVIKTVPYDDFPSIPFPENPKNRVVLPGVLLRTLFTFIAPCASSSAVRPELSSIYLSIEGGVLTAAATDSFRLAEKKVPLSNKGSQGKFLIPAKNALDIAQALPDDDIIMSFDEHQCAFVGDGGMFVSRLTNATYPDYRQIIPKESVVEAVMLRKDFESALKRTTIFSDTFQKVKMSFDPKKNLFSLFARNIDIGESSEAIMARISGSPLDLSFNHRYLATILSLTPAESLSLTAAGIGRPLIIKGVGDTSLMYLVSPMNQ